MKIRITDWCSDDPRFDIGTIHEASPDPFLMPGAEGGVLIVEPGGGEHYISAPGGGYEIVTADTPACRIRCKGHCGQMTDIPASDQDGISMARVERCPQCGNESVEVEWFEEVTS